MGREAVSTLARELPAHDPDVIDIRARAGRMFLFHSRPAEAESTLRLALAGLSLYQRQTAPAKPLMPANYWRQIRAYLGRSLMLQKKYAEAEPMLVEGIKDLEAVREYPAHRSIIPTVKQWLQESSIRRRQEGAADEN
jgi:hypothetical protein